MKRRKRSVEVFSMSFLDVVSCGFGAIILLLVIVKQSGPALVEQVRADLSGVVAGLLASLEDTRSRARGLDEQLAEARRQAAEEEARVTRLRGDLSKVLGEFEATRQEQHPEVIGKGHDGERRRRAGKGNHQHRLAPDTVAKTPPEGGRQQQRARIGGHQKGHLLRSRAQPQCHEGQQWNDDAEPQEVEKDEAEEKTHRDRDP